MNELEQDAKSHLNSGYPFTVVFLILVRGKTIQSVTFKFTDGTEATVTR